MCKKLKCPLALGHHCVCPFAIRVYLTSHIRPMGCLSTSVGSLPETSPQSRIHLKTAMLGDVEKELQMRSTLAPLKFLPF